MQREKVVIMCVVDSLFEEVATGLVIPVQGCHRIAPVHRNAVGIVGIEVLHQVATIVGIHPNTVFIVRLPLPRQVIVAEAIAQLVVLIFQPLSIEQVQVGSTSRKRQLLVLT